MPSRLVARTTIALLGWLLWGLPANGQEPSAASREFPAALVDWVPYHGNPLFSGTGRDSWDRRIRERGYILREDDDWRLWYTGYNPERLDTHLLGYATSPDGFRWLRSGNGPIFEGGWVEDMCVVRHAGTWYMFAEGRQDIAHLLVSQDGIQWQEQGPLDIRTSDGRPLEPGPYGTPTVWVGDDTWYLFYERGDRGVWLATSPDRRVWKNVCDEPVIARGPEAYDRQAIALNQVIRYDGRFYGVYHANADPQWKGPWTTCLAVSDDLLQWTKYAGNPVIRSNDSSGVLVADGQRWRLYTMHPEVKLWLPRADAELARTGPQPLMIEAWQKDGAAKPFATRVLRHLQDFDPPADVPLDRYGGWAVNRQEATGFFHARWLGERWWLIDPEGYPFLHVAVNSVKAGDSPQNREALPVRFGDVQRWREETAGLLRDHGFNGTGSWSDDEGLRTAQSRPVYTPTLNLMSGYGRQRGGTFQEPGHTGYPNRCIFVFDPEFETYANQQAAHLRAWRDDPYLLGYFTDNELPLPADLLDRYLQLPDEDAGRRAADSWLRARGRSGPAEISDADREAWRGHVVDRYFEICARAIRSGDPHHMLLGSRFYGSEKSSAAVFRAAGKHLDAVSVNVYGVWTPTAEMLARWSQWSGKPLLITEWYAKGADSGMANLSGAGWTVPTQQDRGAFYQNFTLGLLESQVCVGWHWFKYMDNDPLDTSTDPSNRDSNKGIVTARYEPHTPLLAAMRQLNRQVYPLTSYFDQRPPQSGGGAPVFDRAAGD